MLAIAFSLPWSGLGCNTVLDDLANEDTNLRSSENVHNPRYSVAIRSKHAELAKPNTLFLALRPPGGFIHMVDIVGRVFGRAILKRNGARI